MIVPHTPPSATQALGAGHSFEQIRGLPPTAWVLLGAGAIALGLGVLEIAFLIARPLALLVLATAVAAALAPIARLLEQHMPRTVAVVAIYLGLAIVLGAFAWHLLPALSRELGDFVQRLPELLTRLQARVSRLAPDGAAFQEAVASTLQQLVGSIASLPMGLLSGIFELLVVVFLSLYFLIAGPRLRRFLVRLFPTRRRRRVARVIDEMARAMGGYLRAAVIDGAIVGVLTWTALAIVGLEYAIPLAALVAVGEIVPYLGPILAAVPAIAIALANSPTQALTVAAVYLVLQQVESHIVTPNIMRSQTDVPPALVVFALAAGYAAGGILGALAAIPLAAACRVLVLRVGAPAVRHAGRSQGWSRG